jgi:hypothetical protein
MAVMTAFALIGQNDAYAFTVNVVDTNGDAVSGFRWLVEEDNTNQSPPGIRVPDSIGVDIHKSHAPVVASGSSAGSSASITTDVHGTPLDPAKRYYVSVLPNSGYTLGGIGVAPGQASATAVVHALPLPTAQVSVLVFEDHNTINNVFDQGERGLGGFTITLSDMGGPLSQDAFGNPLGVIRTCTQADVDAGINNCTTVGEAIIKNLAPGKYGIQAVPPAGTNWVQTATIEGTLTVDAWVKANEPNKFFEGFGTGFYHAFFGFVNPGTLPWAVSPPGGSGTIVGRNVFNHFSRPPVLQGFFPGPPVSECWIGLNDLTARQGLIAVPCDANSNFTINGVPPGNYQLVTWDKPLDALFGFNLVTVPQGGGTVDLGNVLSFRWFGTFEGTVFLDKDQDGFRDPGEQGIAEQNINIRFRDGTIYQAQPTDGSGEYSLSEVFPFFKWLVPEVDFARYKATGMTAAVDYGGLIPPENGWNMPSFGKLNPHPQASVNPNTGNNLSRTETGPVLTQGMHLFLNQTNVIDWGKTAYAPGENGGISGIVFYDTTRAEDDPRYNAPETWQPGIPRVQVNLYQDANVDGVIDDVNGVPGIQLADIDNHPFGWKDGDAKGPEDMERSGNDGVFDLGDAIDAVTTDSWDDNQPTGCIHQRLPILNGVPVRECYDNFGTWNQVRPAVFDGGYAFGPNLPPGAYIVESTTPPGYVLVKEEDKNVDFGDTNTPSPLLLPPVCVGDPHTVPAELSLFPGVPTATPGASTRLCDRKQIIVADKQNAAADFYFYTEVPKAARAVGFVNNDLAAEFDPNSPIYGEKSAPAWIPISIQDWAGKEVARVYSDEFGSYNALIPSTYTVNVPSPSGVSPNMLTIILNHPLLPDGSIDPHYDPSYATAPWTFQFLPGTSSYLDTPIVPVGAFVGYPKSGADVEPADGTPMIFSVTNGAQGPLVCAAGESITITSIGMKQVPNPDYDPNIGGSSAMITRDFSFGNTQGSVTVGGTPLTITSWSNSTITAQVPAGVSTGQLLVTRGDTLRISETGITLHVGGCGSVVNVSAGQSIQAAIDGAAEGSLIIVGPGTYHENIIMHKSVKLQGWGAGSTMIYANPSPAERLAAWHAKVLSVLGTDPFMANEAPGIMVLGTALVTPFPAGGDPRIDGFNIFGAVQGGGIYVDTNAYNLTISNNEIRSSQGSNGGGITIGTDGVPSVNPNVWVEYNRIVRNSGVFGGGGVTIYGGSDNYRIANNIITGNLTRWNGGGIVHSGLSNNGLIADNRITFNEVFFGAAIGGDGGGIFIGSDVANGALPGGLLGSGSGSVKVFRNLVQGNLAGAGSGGGIRAAWINGQDAALLPYTLEILNNIIVNNVAGYSAGGISLQDAVNAHIVNNTVANNDSTATAANAFPAGSLDSLPQGAGIVSNGHTGSLADATGQAFSNPVLVNNIMWHNRSFYNDHTLNGGAGGLAPNPTIPYWDLQVAGAVGSLNPMNSMLSDTTGYDPSNISDGPMFLDEYQNALVSATVIDEGGNAITVRFRPVTLAGDYHIDQASLAIDAGSTAILASYGDLAVDFDNQARPTPGTSADIGADEYNAALMNYSITATATSGGAISPSGTLNVPPGGNGSFTVDPDPGYHILRVTVDGVAQTIPDPFGTFNYTFTNVTANHTIHAVFVFDYIITASSGAGGTISPSGQVYAVPGSDQPFTITPDPGYRIASVLVDGSPVPVADPTAAFTYTFTNVSAIHTISATFVLNPYTITATAGAGGTISPAGAVVVASGADQSFIITPDAGYHIASVAIDGATSLPILDVLAPYYYVFAAVAANHTIEATFALNGSVPLIAPALHDFGVVLANNGTKVKTLTVTNAGTDTLTINGISVTGVNASEFSQTNACSSVPVGGSCTVDVTFAPVAAGFKSAALTIESNAPDGPAAAVLSGVGAIGKVMVLSPNGGETFPTGSVQTIRWWADFDSVAFNLYYTVDGGVTWRLINKTGKVTGSSYTWTVPAFTANKKARIRVVGYRAMNTVAGRDVSNATFTIQVAALTSPTAGATLTSGTPFLIEWTHGTTIRPVAKVRLSYTVRTSTIFGLVWKTITTVAPDPGTNGSYNWTSPAVAAAKPKSKVKVTLLDSAGVAIGTAISGNFTIQP